MQIQVLQDKRHLFWALQLGGWSSWAITYYLGVRFWQSPPDSYWIYLLIVSCVGMLITLLLRSLYHATWKAAPFCAGWQYRRLFAVALPGCSSARSCL